MGTEARRNGNPSCPESHRRRLSHDCLVNRRLEGAAIHGHSGRGSMLPATLQFIIAMLARTLNERMARKVDYLHEEVRVLKEALAAATGKTRIDFTAEQRRLLALKGKQLTAEERRACCGAVTSPAALVSVGFRRDETIMRQRRGRPLHAFPEVLGRRRRTLVRDEYECNSSLARTSSAHWG